MKEPYAQNCGELPFGYKQVRKIDLKENKKEFWTINLISMGIAIITVALGFVFCSFDRYIEFLVNGEIWQGIVSVVIIIVGMVVYIILHELTHGVCFRYFSGRKPKYGFTLMFAYAKSDYYYNKRDYIVIGLAPVVLFFVVFLTLNLLLPIGWFWPIYILQVANLSGAAGDFYVSAVLLGANRSVLIYDTGTGMAIYDFMPQPARLDGKTEDGAKALDKSENPDDDDDDDEENDDDD